MAGLGDEGFGEVPVEAIELAFRKACRGDVPKEGDVMMWSSSAGGWIFTSPLIDAGAVSFDGNLAAGDVIEITSDGASFVRFRGTDGDDPAAGNTNNPAVFDTKVEAGAGSIIEEDLGDGSLIFTTGGICTVSAVVTYADLNQETSIRIGLVRGDNIVLLASSIADIAGTQTFAVAATMITAIFKADDRVFVAFGRTGGQNFTNLTVINADLIATVQSLDTRA